MKLGTIISSSLFGYRSGETTEDYHGLIVTLKVLVKL